MISLALRHARYRWGRTLLLCACVIVAAGLPLISRSVVASFEDSLRDRAGTVPLLVGSAGSRFDLVLSGLHWRASDIKPIPLSVTDEIRAEPGVIAIPVHVRFQARGVQIAAVPFEYFEFRQLTPSDGRLVAGLGEAVLGAATAKQLGLKPGDELPSDQLRSYDITSPPAVMLRVVGILNETGTADDRVVFVDLETAWVLEGIAHGHEEASAVTDPNLLIGRSEDRVALSGAVIEYQRIDDSTAHSFHLHADREKLPVSAVLVIPSSDKSEAIVLTRMNADPTRQALSPSVISEELIGSVLRIRSLLDAISVIVGTSMLGLLILVALLTYRARADEVRTLTEVGASRSQICVLFLIEFAGVIVIGVVAAYVVAQAASGASEHVLSVFM